MRLDPRLALPKKRSLTIAGHRTSITLEDAFWAELKGAAAEMGLTVAGLVAAIDACRGAGKFVGGDKGVPACAAIRAIIS